MAGTQLPGPGFLGEAREGSSSVAGTLQVTRQTFQSLQSLTWGWAVDQAPSLVERYYYLALCAHCPWGCLGRNEKKLLLENPPIPSFSWC